MMRLAAAGVTMLALAVLAGAGWLVYKEVTEAKAGVIVQKSYYPETANLIPMYTSCGNGCTSMTTVLIVTPECYELYFRDGEETGDACVTPTEYEAASVGTWWGQR